MSSPLVYADTAAWIESIATAAAVLVGIVAALYARSQLKDGRRTQQRQRVYDLQQQFDAEILPILDKLFSFVAQDQETAKSQWREWTTAEPQRQWELTRALNFFELVSSEYLNDLLDKKVAHRNLVYTVVLTWPRVRWFVFWLRDQQNEDRLLDQWQKAYEKASPVYKPAID
jgi:hypothetical protein